MERNFNYPKPFSKLLILKKLDANVKQIIVAGIDTEIGKTVISTILCAALKADYWKPIQAGDLHLTDADKVGQLTNSITTQIHPEGIRLQHPMSPHASADLEGIQIEIAQLTIPQTDRNLVIELAGGLMVPINHQQLNIDLLEKWQLPVVLVSKYYLGSINHTLLSWQLLKDRNIPFLGFIFNGEKNQATFDIILEYTKAPCLLEVNQHEKIDKSMIQEYAKKLHL